MAYKFDGLQEGHIFWQYRHNGQDYGSILASPQPFTVLPVMDRIDGAEDSPDQIGERVGRNIAETIRELHGVDDAAGIAAELERLGA